MGNPRISTKLQTKQSTYIYKFLIYIKLFFFIYGDIYLSKHCVKIEGKKVSTMDKKCRLCLVESDNREMYDLYGDSNYDDLMRACQEEEDNTKLKLYEKVEFCCGIRVNMKLKLLFQKF